MKKIISLLFFVFCSLCFPSLVRADVDASVVSDEFASHFLSEITINDDTSLLIKETIEYQTTQEKHGIYRYIPIRYNKDGLVYTASIKNISVKDKDNNPIKYSKSASKGNVTLKIGDPNITFSGEKTYIISYTVENALNRFDDHDELYWDIVGEGWNFPIEQSKAVISSPFASIAKVTCYTGPVGDDNKLCQTSFSSNEVEFSYDKPITYGSNMTVVVSLDQNNLIHFPTKFEKILKTITDNIALALIFAPTVFLLFLWYTKGRDYVFLSPNVFNLNPTQPQQLKPLFYWERTPYAYEPIKELTPGEAGTVLDEKTDNQDIVAEIIDLARKKYLKIESVKTKGFLGIGNNQDYKFIKLKEENGLVGHQKYLFNSLLNNKTDVLLSDLKGTFYTHMSKIREMINTSVKEKKLFTGDPSAIRTLYMVLVFVVGFFSFFLVGVAININIMPEFAIPILIVLEVINFIVAYNMPQKTAVGTNFYMQTKGLKAMIKHGAWRESIAEKNLFIEEILPFAIALGVVKQLSHEMEKLNMQPPEYLNAVMVSNMNMNNFVSSFSSQTVSNLSYNPSSSSMSGGSGFSGGSSGGGGGGGGGGSW